MSFSGNNPFSGRSIHEAQDFVRRVAELLQPMVREWSKKALETYVAERLVFAEAREAAYRAKLAELEMRVDLLEAKAAPAVGGPPNPDPAGSR